MAAGPPPLGVEWGDHGITAIHRPPPTWLRETVTPIKSALPGGKALSLLREHHANHWVTQKSNVNGGRINTAATGSWMHSRAPKTLLHETDDQSRALPSLGYRVT